MKKSKVIVIGAGLSGLTTAYRLRKLGYPVEVYEARNRPGGRVHTVRFGNSYEELGGKNINDGGAGLTIRALIDEVGLKVKPYILRDARPYFHHGKVYPYERLFKNAPEPTNEALRSLREKVPHCKNLKELLDPFYKDPLLRDFIEFSMTLWEGLPSHLLASQYLDFGFWTFYQELYDRKIDIEQNRFPGKKFDIVEGGNSRLIEALLQALPGCVHYNSPLRKMTKAGRDGTMLHFDGGKTVVAEYVVLALPCSTLRDVEFEQDFIPEDQLYAINTQKYGTNAKLLVPVTNAEESGLATLEDAVVWFNADHTVMTVYYGGESGVFDARSKEVLSNIYEKDSKELHKMYPSIRLSDRKPIAPSSEIWAQYNQPLAISWMNEEFSKGSYACYGYDQFDFFEEMVEDFGEVTKKVFRTIRGQIFFAGEHAAIIEPATLEGAAIAGEEAAKRVMAAQKLQG